MKRRRLLVVLACAAVLIAGITAVSYLCRPPALYRVTILPSLGGAYMVPNAINDPGQVVGIARMKDRTHHMFLWDRQHGIQDSLAGPAPASFGKEVMLSDLLAQAGYNCGYAGRWGMGDDAKPQHGFRFWHTSQEKDYLPEAVTQGGVQFLEEQKKEQPFLLVVSYQGPHAPYEGLPQKYYDMYAKTAFTTAGWQPAAKNAAEGKEYLADTVGSLRKCAAAISALDDQIPALTGVLDKKGVRDNTLVIFTAACGLLAGRHGLWDAGRGSSPINMYTEAIETPMIWNWPGMVPVEGGRTELVSSYDLFPSLCEVTGVRAPGKLNLCGRSYAAPAMNHPLPRRRPWRNLVFGAYLDTEMVRDLRFKVVIRGYGAGPNELYDLRKDPEESSDQYENDQYLTIRNSLGESLRQWREKTV